MAFGLVTLEDLIGLLDKRIGGQATFWSVFEKEMAINEALNVWQLLVGEFSAEGFVDPDDAEFVDSIKKLVDIDTGTSTTFQLIETTDTVPLPRNLSIRRAWRVGTATTVVGTTTATYTYEIPLHQIAEEELGYEHQDWVGDTASTAPDYWFPGGVNLVGFYPRAAGGVGQEHTVYLEYYSGSRILNHYSDYLQLGAEEVDRILDYSVWHLNIKSGTDEAFKNTSPLKPLFMMAAKLRNSKLRGSQLYKDYQGSDYGESLPDRDPGKPDGNDTD